MDGSSYTRGGRGRGGAIHDGGRPLSRNKHWSATDGGSRSHTPNHSDGERWERGGHRGGGRGRGTRGPPRIYHNVSLRVNHAPKQQERRATPEVAPIQYEETYNPEDELQDDAEEESTEQGDEIALLQEIHEPDLDKAEDREKFYQELVKARETERKVAIAEGKMDDPLVPKRLEDAISIVGTCMDMCPRFERYRRERENNLFEWETIPGTKRINHNRAVKMYERAAGDKTLPSDLRPPHVLKQTLDYLFHDLLPRGGFSATFNFIRDRSRSVRNDFTMQHITGPLAIECHDRCARFHILALHFERDRSGFSIPLEEQQLMNTLQSLKEFYEDQRGRYESPTELEMRVYHRLIHIRDQKERHEDIPDHITSHPVFKLTTEFRQHVQAKSAPISKTSKLVVTEEGMRIFSQLAQVLNEQGSMVMVYLVACLLERLFGKDTIDDIESIRGDLSISDIIDGVSSHGHIEEIQDDEDGVMEDGETEEQDEEDYGEEGYDEEEQEAEYEQAEQTEDVPLGVAPTPFNPSATQWPSSAFAPPQPSASTSSAPPPSMPPVTKSAFAGLVSAPNVFGTVFAPSIFSTSSNPSQAAPASVFGNSAQQPSSVFGNSFGVSAPASTLMPAPAPAPAPPPAAAPSVFQPQANGFSFNMPPPTFASATPQSNIFSGFKSTPPPATFTPPAPASHEPSISLPGGSSNPSPFTNPFSNGISTNGSRPPSFFNLPGPPDGSASNSLNPKAPEFAPPQPSKTSIFSQSISIPPVSQPIKPETAAPTIPNFNPPNATTATTSSSDHATNGAFTEFPSSSTQSQTPPPSSLGKRHTSSKSATPPANRLGPHPILKIDTNTSTSSTSSSTSAAAPSPRVPPPMPRQQPISLPSTPTMVLQPPNPLLGHLRNNLMGSPSSSHSQPDVLSPLIMHSPTLENQKSFTNFSPISTPKILRKFSVRAPSPPSSNGKGKAPERHYTVEEVEELKRKAAAFGQRTSLVKECFERWVQRATDRIAYLEARRHGDEYRERLQRSGGERQNRALVRPTSRNGMVVLDKKRRVSRNGAEHGDGQMIVLPVKKRARKSEYRPPRTDEDLAKRLKENHEEHEQRWAHGSFLQVIRKYVKATSPSTLKLPWNIWLSLNPDSDATAIWLERKFDVPISGSWASESVFSIPLSSATGLGNAGYPGLIVFECTPLGDVTDDLEKKYHILDDCSRLREIIKTLSPRRHFVPSLLVICWGEPEEIPSTSEFFDMVKKLVAESVLQSSHTLAMTSTTNALDDKVDTALKSMTLDTEGKLVQTLALRNVFKLFEPTYSSFMNEWIENCNINGRFNWSLYGQFVQASIILLNHIAQSVKSLLELSGPQDPLPHFDYGQLDDSDSCYDDINEWLSTLSSRDDARLVATDLQSHRNIGQDFPAQIFIEHLFELNEIRFERLFPKTADSPRPILISSITSALQSFKDALRPHQLKLSQTYNFSVRRSPKRRAYSVATSDQASPEAKRPRLSASIASVDDDGDHTLPNSPQMNGRQTPSPTGSTVSLATTEGPTVTVAMLRALTRDLKKKYGGS